MKTIYISGPITDLTTGQPREGWQKDFLDAEAKLRRMGFEVLNPVNIAKTAENYWCASNHVHDGRPMPTLEELPPVPRWVYLSQCMRELMYLRHNAVYPPGRRDKCGTLDGLYVLGHPDDIQRSYGTMTEINFALSAYLPVFSQFYHGYQIDNLLRQITTKPTLAEIQRTLNK